MDILLPGCLTKVLEKYADPLLEKMKNFSKEEWEKFKIDFDLAFVDYLNKSYEKFSKIKTILYRTEPKYIYDFFEIPYLKKQANQLIKVNSVDKILDISNFVIIQGTGGLGKSTLMKHLFINEIERKDLIPIFFELKDINDLHDDYDINEIFWGKLNNLGSTLDKKHMNYALESGCFLFLLDGYDEIDSNKKDVFFMKLDAFCDKYSGNYFIISSRPYSEFIEFQRFTVLTTCPLNKDQAISLVDKIDFDSDIKQRFIKELDKRLYENYTSFASNPLLLNIMLMTFDNYAEIPEKLHLFYSNAFETLYSKHDATKAGYRREMRSALSFDAFRKVFSYFCFISYTQNKIEFTSDELINILNKIPTKKFTLDVNKYIYDLVNSLCVLYKDGLNFKFAHRSFQEYFTAFFLKELSDDNMQKMAMQVIKKDAFRASRDSVFPMLYDMSEDRFERNILLPVALEAEKNCFEMSKYDFYFQEIVKSIKFSNEPEENSLWLIRSNVDEIVDFLYSFSRLYIERDKEKRRKIYESSDKLLEYLIRNKQYKIEMSINIKEIKKDDEMYCIVKESWIGERISIMSSLADRLNAKQNEIEMDLSSLLI